MRIIFKNPMYVDFSESTLLYQMYEDFAEALQKNAKGMKLSYWQVLCGVGKIYAPYFAKLQGKDWLSPISAVNRYLEYRDEVKDFEETMIELEAEKKSNKKVIWNSYWKVSWRARRQI